MNAALEPDCVRRGQQITLVVESVPDGGVAFLAFYANGENGADPPFGDGHGGNDGGLIGKDGRYEATWTVSPTAPVGVGHVELSVARGGRRGAATVPFEVVDAVGGTC